MDQPQSAADVIEGAAEVLGVAAQVLKDRVVFAKATGYLTALGPVTPGPAQGCLEVPQLACIVGRGGAQKILQGALGGGRSIRSLAIQPWQWRRLPKRCSSK